MYQFFKKSIFAVFASLACASLLEAGFAPPITHNFSPPLGATGETGPFGTFEPSYYSDANGNFMLVYVNFPDLEAIQYVAGTDTWTAPQKINVFKESQRDELEDINQALSPTGNYAVATWAFGDQIHTAIKPRDGTWTKLPSIQTGNQNFSTDNVAIAVDSKGKVLASWSESDFKKIRIYGAYYNGQKWTNKLLDTFAAKGGSRTLVNSDPGNTFINSKSNGDFIISWTSSKGNVTANFSANSLAFSAPKTFTPTAQTIYRSSYLGFTPTSAQFLSANPSGAASLAWFNKGGLFATFFNNQEWSPVKKVIQGTSTAFLSQSVKNRVNKLGQTILPYILNEGSASTVYAVDTDGVSFKTSKVFASKTALKLPSAAIDDFGNAVVSWVSVGKAEVPYVSVRNAYEKNWSAPIRLEGITDLGINLNSAPLITATGDVYILFQGLPSRLRSIQVKSVNLFVGTNLFTSPLSFRGRVVKNKFATQTQLVNRLSWTRSPDKATVVYKISRNGVDLKAVDASTLHYNDRGVKAHTSYTYTLQPFNAEGEPTALKATTIVRTSTSHHSHR
jgi:hypothetical protein